MTASGSRARPISKTRAISAGSWRGQAHGRAGAGAELHRPADFHPGTVCAGCVCHRSDRYGHHPEVTLSSHLPGDVLESNENNNQGSVAVSITNAPSDLRVISVQPATPTIRPGATTITWTVRTMAPAPGAVRILVDVCGFPRIRPSTLGARTRVEGSQQCAPLGAGQTYTESLNVTLPAGFDGDYYIYVIADATASYKSSRRPNRPRVRMTARWLCTRTARMRRTRVTMSARALFTLTTASRTSRSRRCRFPIRIPDRQTVQVTFTVSNLGTRATRTDGWIDALYLSGDPSLDTTDRRLRPCRMLCKACLPPVQAIRAPSV